MASNATVASTAAAAVGEAMRSQAQRQSQAAQTRRHGDSDDGGSGRQRAAAEEEDWTPTVEPLPSAVRASLRSSIAIPSVSQALAELLANAVDSGARRISLVADFDAARFSVHDDGRGMTLSDLQIIGQRHATSKCSGLDDLTSSVSARSLGWRGEALSSLAHLARLEIETRPRSSSEVSATASARNDAIRIDDDEDTPLEPASKRQRTGAVQAVAASAFSGLSPSSLLSASSSSGLSPAVGCSSFRKVISHGRTLLCGFAATPRAGAGTTVTISDLYARMPVRARKAAEERERGKEKERITKQIMRIALIHSAVEFALYDASIRASAGSSSASATAGVPVTSRHYFPSSADSSETATSSSSLVSQQLPLHAWQRVWHKPACVSLLANFSCIFGANLLTVRDGGGGIHNVFSLEQPALLRSLLDLPSFRPHLPERTTPAGADLLRHMRVSGFLQHPATLQLLHRDYQFVYVNAHPVQHKRVAQAVESMYERVGKYLSSAAGSAAGGGEGSLEDSPQRKERGAATAALQRGSIKTKVSGATGVGPNPAKQGRRRHACWLLHLRVPPRLADLLLEADKSGVQFADEYAAVEGVRQALKSWLFAFDPELRQFETAIFPPTYLPLWLERPEEGSGPEERQGTAAMLAPNSWAASMSSSPSRPLQLFHSAASPSSPSQPPTQSSLPSAPAASIVAAPILASTSAAALSSPPSALLPVSAPLASSAAFLHTLPARLPKTTSSETLSAAPLPPSSTPLPITPPRSLPLSFSQPAVALKPPSAGFHTSHRHQSSSGRSSRASAGFLSANVQQCSAERSKPLPQRAEWQPRSVVRSIAEPSAEEMRSTRTDAGPSSIGVVQANEWSSEEKDSGAEEWRTFAANDVASEACEWLPVEDDEPAEVAPQSSAIAVDVSPPPPFFSEVRRIRDSEPSKVRSPSPPATLSLQDSLAEPPPPATFLPPASTAAPASSSSIFPAVASGFVLSPSDPLLADGAQEASARRRGATASVSCACPGAHEQIDSSARTEPSIRAGDAFSSLLDVPPSDVSSSSSPPAAIASSWLPHQSSSGPSASSSAQFLPLQVPRSALSSLHVIGQVDAKFVAARLGSLLLLIDQHAADERRRLEYLQSNLALYVERLQLLQPRSLTISSAEATVLHSHQAEINAWGFHYSFALASATAPVANTTLGSVRFSPRSSLPPSRLLLHSVPLVCGVELDVDDLREYLQQLRNLPPLRPPAETAATGNSASAAATLAHFAARTPTPVQRVLNYKACRSAVMFGDVLHARTLRSILRALARCSFPYNCAHGRPTMTPLVHIKQRDEARMEDGWNDEQRSQLLAILSHAH